jgi:hypothetical protein
MFMTTEEMAITALKKLPSDKQEIVLELINTLQRDIEAAQKSQSSERTLTSNQVLRRNLRSLRAKIVDGGGIPLSMEEIDAEISEQRDRLSEFE